MKRLYITIRLFLAVLLFIPIRIHAQCPNLDFSMGDFTNWQTYGGYLGNGIGEIYLTPIPGRHTIMDAAQLIRTGQLMDENCNTIPKVPAGFSHSLKLGNNSTKYKIDAAEYTLTIDSNNSFFILRFAWVMEDSTHDQYTEPRFTICIKDTLGRTMSYLPYGDMRFTPSQDSTDLACKTSSLLAHNWTAIGFNLESFMGQKIKIYFETHDCWDGDHSGYAYVLGECRPAKIDIRYCKNKTLIRMHAPAGFAWYKWTRNSDPTWIVEGGGRSFQDLIIAGYMEGDVFTCEVTSALGYSATLHSVAKEASIEADFDYINYDTCMRKVTFVNKSIVKNDNISFRWEINGKIIISKDTLFTYTFPNPDTATTYEIVQTVIGETGCVSTSSKSITVYPTPELKIVSSNTFFTEGKDTLTAIFKGNFPAYQWSWILNDSTTGTNNTSNPLVVENAGTYWIEAQEVEGCFLSDSVQITNVKAFFRYGVIQSGTIDFTTHNNKNWYDTCTRSVTFVDSSLLYHTAVRSRLWIIEEMNIGSKDSLFTVTFPDEERTLSYTVRLHITTEENVHDVYTDYIIVTPSSKISIDLSREQGTTVLDRLTAVPIRGNFISYQWTWVSATGNENTSTGNYLGLTEPWISCFLQAEDSKGCYIRDTIYNNGSSSISEYAKGSWTLEQNIPNPARSLVFIPYHIPEQGKISFEVYSVIGQLLHKEEFTSPTGKNKIEYNVSNLSSGIYFYVLRYNNHSLNRKMIVVK